MWNIIKGLFKGTEEPTKTLTKEPETSHVRATIPKGPMSTYSRVLTANVPGHGDLYFINGLYPISAEKIDMDYHQFKEDWNITRHAFYLRGSLPFKYMKAMVSLNSKELNELYRKHGIYLKWKEGNKLVVRRNTDNQELFNPIDMIAKEVCWAIINKSENSHFVTEEPKVKAEDVVLTRLIPAIGLYEYSITSVCDSGTNNRKLTGYALDELLREGRINLSVLCLDAGIGRKHYFIHALQQLVTIANSDRHDAFMAATEELYYQLPDVTNNGYNVEIGEIRDGDKLPHSIKHIDIKMIEQLDAKVYMDRVDKFKEQFKKYLPDND